MAEITPRKLRFPFDEDFRIDFDQPDEELARGIAMLSVSLTLPYLEPYLIRTMKSALKQIRDERIAEDARCFSAQEGHHFRAHADFNQRVHASFDPDTRKQLTQIEAALESDYQRFSREKSLRFNVCYAEGFEAMTCAAAIAFANHVAPDDDGFFPGGEIWHWHLAEEIEHRTVTFEVYKHLYGSYPYRLAVGTWAQLHFLRTLRRLSRCMTSGLGRTLAPPSGPEFEEAGRRYWRTFSPFYDPAKIDMPPHVRKLLARYSEMAATA